ADRIRPYIGGEEANTSPTHEHIRYAIDFFDRPLGRRDTFPAWSSLTQHQRREHLTRGLVPADYPGEVAEDWPELLDIVRRRVKPERDKQKREAIRVRWWQYADKRPGLYAATASMGEILIASRVSPHCSIARVPSQQI